MKKVRCIIIGLVLVVLSGIIFAESEIPGLLRSGQYSQGALNCATQPGPI